MKLLLHCCCAPCTISCIENLQNENIETDLFWYNPNIHPYVEYKLRYGSLLQLSAGKKYKLTLIDDYGLLSFLNEVLPEIENRCEKCYCLRLEKTASAAAQEGYNAFTSTLLISPYQNHEALRHIGGQVQLKYGVDFFYRDFRPYFQESQKQARAESLYMQKYCGCIFSEEERYSKDTSMK